MYKNTLSRPVLQEVLGCLVESAERAISWQLPDGAMPAGHNGPYQDPETSVRNTSHWGITFQTTWEATGNKKLLRAAEACADFLLQNLTPKSPFHCRNKPGKDKTNGLIGQAWAMEALIELGVRQNRKDLIDAAEAIFKLHPFLVRAGGWKTVNLDGSPNILDRTFNHQLWFCAIGTMLLATGRNSASEPINQFLSRLDVHLRLYANGLIRHITPLFLADGFVEKSKGALRALRMCSQDKGIYVKSLGYHAFNTYAFALIQRHHPSAKLASHPTVKRSLNYIVDGDFEREVESSPYGYPYNPPGFEVAVTVNTFFPDRDDLVDRWLSRQIDKTYNVHTKQFDLHASDVKTVAARIYEITRIYSNGCGLKCH